MSKAKNNNLHKAKKAKNDEFYTQLTDIERELKEYKSHFKGKVVLCNCDDPKTSNFWKYFDDNFKHLGLKKLIASHYDKGKASYVLTASDKGMFQAPLMGDGDFRSEECLNFLSEADIVVTNPPFSLFREYVAQLMEYKKKFLIVGNMNAVTYKEIFGLIEGNKMWVGCTNPKEFIIPGGETKKFGNVNWFTNLSHKKRNEEIILFKKYNPREYPKYDNYDAIEVSKTVNIPVDYKGAIGVPISFLDKYNPGQFEIIKFRKGDDDKDLQINSKCLYFRIIIKRK